MVVSALVLSFLIKTFFFQSFWIPSGSMEPTLVYGDRILVSKWRPDPLPLRRGDIVVFKDPGTWLDHSPEDGGGLRFIGKEILTFTGLLPEDAGEHLVKRVIGLPGEQRSPIGDGAIHAEREQFADALEIHGVPPPSSRNSQARASRQSAFTVLIDKSMTAAVSSIDKPLKKRSSMRRLWR